MRNKKQRAEKQVSHGRRPDSCIVLDQGEKLELLEVTGYDSEETSEESPHQFLFPKLYKALRVLM